MNYLRGALSAASQYYRDINPSTLTGAIDVIVVRRKTDGGEDDLACSPFHVRFGKWQVLRPSDKKVKVLVNGLEIPFNMKIGDAGEAFFVFETDDDVPDSLITSPILEATQPGQSNVQIESGRFGAKEKAGRKGTESRDSGRPLGEPEPLDLDSPSAGASKTPRASRLALSKPPTPPTSSSEGETSGPSNVLGRAAHIGKAVMRAVVEVERDKQQSVRDEVDVARNIAAHAYESATDGTGTDRKDDRDDEVLLHLKKGEGEPPTAVCSNDVVLDFAGYHSKDASVGLMKETRLGASRQNSWRTINEEPDEYDSYERPSTPRSGDPSEQATPTQTPDTSRSTSPDRCYDSSPAKHHRSHTIAAFRAASEPPELERSPGNSPPIYSWEWGAFPTPSPMKSAFSPPHGDTLEAHRSLSVPPELEIDADTPTRSKTQGSYPSPPSTPKTLYYREGAELTADENNGRRFLVTVDGRTYEFELSICEDLDQGVDEMQDARHFREGQVSFRRFMKFPAVVHDKNLVVKWDDRYITRHEGSPLMDCLIKWREAALAKPTNARALEEEEPLSSSDEREPDTERENLPKKTSSSWVRWWRSSRSEPQPHPQPQSRLQSSATLNGGGNEHRLGLIPSMSAPAEAGAGVRDTTPVPFPSAFAPSNDSSRDRKRFAKTLRLTSDQLKQLDLKSGLNSVTFSLSASGATACTASIFLWESTDSVVVSDIDGTITKSDALGHVFTMIGRDWTHIGVAKLYTDICRNGYKIIYLTSRAIGQADSTRYYLKGIKQNNYQLPEGPVIMSPDRLMASFHREVIMRKPEVFKMACLRDIQRLFGEGGNPFYAGFGNRITDALSYRSVNIPSQRIFTIDSTGEVKMELLEVTGYKSSYIHLTDLVDQMFPPIHHKSAPEFTDFNFWKVPVQEFPLPDLSPPSPALSARSDTSGQSTFSRLRNFSLRHSARPLLPLPATQGGGSGGGLREMSSLERLRYMHIRSEEALNGMEEGQGDVNGSRERRAWNRLSMDNMSGSLSGSQADLEFDEETELDENEEEREYEGEGEGEGEGEDPEEAAEEGFDDDLLATGEMESVPFLLIPTVTRLHPFLSSSSTLLVLAASPRRVLLSCCSSTSLWPILHRVHIAEPLHAPRENQLNKASRTSGAEQLVLAAAARRQIMATLVATSPPPMSMNIGRSMFAPGLAPPSPAYSPPPPPTNEAVLPSVSPAIASISTPTSVPAPVLAPSLFAARDAHAPPRPAKDIAAFNSLLPRAVEFVEGSSSGTLGAAFSVVEGKYEPINASPKVGVSGQSESRLWSKPSPQKPSKKDSAEQETRTSLYTRPIDLTWPVNVAIGSGLINLGNTCFLNSALQCLLHTPPLVRILSAHSRGDQCRVKNGFCMTCTMRQVMIDSFKKGRPFSPFPITKNLNVIAKHLRRGRQEDSHEFLRYAVDSLQKSCLAGYPPKLDPKIAETTWVHKIFGGRLRSRVTCSSCGHNSDTFDSILDLSIDVYNCNGLKDALKKFTAIDYLKGVDKYKCEKCKRPVNAEKQFTIHEAPAVLTVHLKRFTPLGRKLQHPIRYDERLSLQQSMSEGQHGPTYMLYGVISHAGSGPNSGHYYAHVRGADGAWYEMNDDAVDRAPRGATNMKNAYMLFYIREKGQALEAALNGSANGLPLKRKSMPNGEEMEDDSDGDRSKKLARPLIGPVVPAHLQTPPTGPRRLPETPKSNPQSDLLRQKIKAVEKERTRKVQHVGAHVMKALVDYEDDSDPEEMGERVECSDALTQNSGVPSSSPSSYVMNGLRKKFDGDDQDGGGAGGSASSPSRPPPTSPLPTPTPSPVTTIAPTSFYGTSSSKRKSRDDDMSNGEATDVSRGLITSSNWKKRELIRPAGGSCTLLGSANPYGRSRLENNLNSAREDREERQFRPRALTVKNRYSRKTRPLM